MKLDTQQNKSREHCPPIHCTCAVNSVVHIFDVIRWTPIIKVVRRTYRRSEQVNLLVFFRARLCEREVVNLAIFTFDVAQLFFTRLKFKILCASKFHFKYVSHRYKSFLIPSNTTNSTSTPCTGKHETRLVLPKSGQSRLREPLFFRFSSTWEVKI